MRSVLLKTLANNIFSGVHAARIDLDMIKNSAIDLQMRMDNRGPHTLLRSHHTEINSRLLVYRLNETAHKTEDISTSIRRNEFPDMIPLVP
jgi:hypothetical protein